MSEYDQAAAAVDAAPANEQAEALERFAKAQAHAGFPPYTSKRQLMDDIAALGSRKGSGASDVAMRLGRSLPCLWADQDAGGVG